MIYEIALLPIRADQIDAFTSAFSVVTPMLMRAKGYVGHMLTQGVEMPSHFTLIVQWQTLEDHTQGFEPSEDHQVFMAGLNEYFAEEPTVNHVRAVSPNGRTDFISARED